LIKEAISGPNLGSGAESFALEGLRPVGCCTTGAGAGIAAGVVGGGMFASGALHGMALAGGARPIVAISPVAAADATNSETVRVIGDMSHLSAWQDAALTSSLDLCDDSDQRGSCDQ
jgi:hypothetical protein